MCVGCPWMGGSLPAGPPLPACDAQALGLPVLLGKPGLGEPRCPLGGQAERAPHSPWPETSPKTQTDTR